jgi:hypothetical protein
MSPPDFSDMLDAPRMLRAAAAVVASLSASLLVAACASTSVAPNVGPSVDAAAPEADAGMLLDAGAAVTFHEHVEPVLQARCQSCHREGGSGPFALETYAQAKLRGPALAASTAARRMPPWGAGPTADCAPQRQFQGDLRMTEGEIVTLATWVAQGMPEGDPAKAPPKATFTSDALTDATHTLTIPRYRVAPATRDDMRCFVVDPQLAEDTWFDASSVVAGDPAVVHHALVFLDPSGASRAKGGAAGNYPCFGGPGISNTSLLAAWAPGVPPTRYPAEVGVKIPRGALLVFQIHYHPADTAREDATSFLLRRRAAMPTWSALVRLIGNFGSAPTLLAGPNDPSGTPTFLIPAGARDHTETMEFTMPASVPELPLATMGTHMHWVGTTMTVQIARGTAREGQPANECLIATPHYDFNWQRGYSYDAPIAQLPTIKGGDRIRMRCTYDNALENPRVARALAEQRLASPVDVRLGEETLDEMCLGAFTLLTPAF